MPVKAVGFHHSSILLIASLSVFAYGQSGEEHGSQAIKAALQRADWQTAATLADSALAHYREYSTLELAEIHSLRALVYFEQAEASSAQAHLALALQPDPNLVLDPIFFPPQMQSMFEKLKPKILTLPSADVPLRYVFTPDRRVGGAWRSLVVPGWGQMYKGEKRRGRIFAIAAGVMAGATLATHFLREQAEADYRKAGETEVGGAYDKFNRYHILRNNLALGLGIVWSAAVLDALIKPPKPTVRP